MKVQRKAIQLDAVYFDGSESAARAIRDMSPMHVNIVLSEHDSVALQVSKDDKFSFVPVNVWVLLGEDGFRTMTQADFDAKYEPTPVEAKQVATKRVKA